VNIGNPAEITVMQLAEAIRDAAGSSSEIVHIERPEDDPEMRRPDISLARRLLDWKPVIPLQEGLVRTVEWARASWV
jgi:dTDP-glucose 4,6-dehydratase